MWAAGASRWLECLKIGAERGEDLLKTINHCWELIMYNYFNTPLILKVVINMLKALLYLFRTSRQWWVGAQQMSWNHDLTFGLDWVDESETWGGVGVGGGGPCDPHFPSLMSQTAQLMLRYQQDNAIPVHRRHHCHADNGAGKWGSFQKLPCRMPGLSSCSLQHLSNSDWISGVVLTQAIRVECAAVQPLVADAVYTATILYFTHKP